MYQSFMICSISVAVRSTVMSSRRSFVTRPGDSAVSTVLERRSILIGLAWFLFRPRRKFRGTERDKEDDLWNTNVFLFVISVKMMMRGL